MQIKVNPSKSGKTFSVEFRFKDADAEYPDFAIKGCKLADGKDGQFVSGPSAKMDDGKWFNYTFFGKGLSEYIVKEANKTMKQESKKTTQTEEDDIPF